MAFLGGDGKSGEVRVGGRVAAGLRDWTLKPEDGNWRVMAMLVDINPLYLDSPAPKELRLHMGKRIWRWRNVTFERDEHERAAIVAVGDFEAM